MNPDEVLERFLQAKRDDSKVTPVKWIRTHIASGTMGKSRKDEVVLS